MQTLPFANSVLPSWTSAHLEPEHLLCFLPKVKAIEERNSANFLRSEDLQLHNHHCFFGINVDKTGTYLVTIFEHVCSQMLDTRVTFYLDFRSWNYC